MNQNGQHRTLDAGKTKAIAAQYRDTRKDIILRHNLGKKLMTVYCRELRPNGSRKQFYDDKTYPVEWFYIDKNWFYHRLEIVKRETLVDGMESYLIIDFLCDPMYGYLERSASVYKGLNVIASKDLCERQLKGNYGKPVKKDDIPLTY